MTEWRDIGPIVQLQVQRASLKVGESTKRYAPENGLVSVERFTLTADGITATMAGETVIDMHHRHHPQSHNRDSNPVSIGFTSHYRDMDDYFGWPLPVGIAGENIIVETEAHFSEDDLQGQLAIRRADGPLVVIHNLYAIPPCRPFAAYCLRREAEAPVIAETLRFLATGARGFCGQLADAGQFEVAVGDWLTVR